MNESKPQNSNLENPGAPEIPATRNVSYTLPCAIPASASHQILTLVGSSFLVFEFIFLYLYFDRFWFAVDLSIMGIPCIMLSLAIAHFLLILAESDRVSRIFFFFRKGSPLVVYRKWLSLDEDGIKFGMKHLRYEAVDELELTWFGNLIFKSNALCGKKQAIPDTVLKIPFAAADFSKQEILLALLKEKNESIKLNKRLATGRSPALQKGSQITQLATAGIMSLVLLDLGFSSFYYLELLKNYYLAETDILLGNNSDFESHFQRAEELRLHPLPISWVSSKFLKNSSVSAGTWAQRARVLWLSGRHKEAIENSRKSVQEAPTNLRHRLFLTRLLVEENLQKETREQLDEILKDHKHSLLPRLYILAIEKAKQDENSEDKNKLGKIYKEQLDFCYEDTFQNEPHWPPGGNRHFMELFYSDDIKFLLDRYLQNNYQAPKYSLNYKENANSEK